MEPILIIMAAGMGSRYGGTKQIDPISKEGDIIMDFSLYDAYQAGFRRVVFIIKEDFEEKFRAHIDPRAGLFFDVTYVHQEVGDIPEGFKAPTNRTRPWGTGHAVLAARNVTDAPFAVINADDYYGREAFSLIYDYLKNSADASHHCMVGFKVENTLSENGTVARGICKESNGRLADIEEHLEVGRETSGEYAGTITGINTSGVKEVIEDGSPVSMNLWGFGKEFMDVLQSDFPAALREILAEDPLKGEFFLPSCIDAQIKSGRASVDLLHSNDKWFGVTYKDDKPFVVSKFAEMKKAGKYPADLWK